MALASKAFRSAVEYASNQEGLETGEDRCSLIWCPEVGMHARAASQSNDWWRLTVKRIKHNPSKGSLSG